MIEVVNISKSFGTRRVIDNFSATFKVGATCIIGESGAGKTTLANILLGLVVPDSGYVRGLEKMRVGCVFQEDRLIEELSAVKNVMLAANNEKLGEARGLLYDLGLLGSVDCPVATLSGGMKRRVAIARALVNPADVYIFDEPFKGLDDALKAQVIDIIKLRTKHAISIFITHDLSDITALNAEIITI